MQKLCSSHVDIWRFELNHPNWDDLTEDELSTAKSFHHHVHQIRFASGRSALKAILKQYVDLPNRVIFDKNAYGKLHLNAYPGLQFNLSHSKDHALVAVGFEHPVGIDLEHHQGVDIVELAGMLYSPQEINHLKTFATWMQPMVFFNLWSKKEAFIKAIGMGLSYPTQQFSTTFGLRYMQSVENWKIYSWMPSLYCAAAVCMHPSVQTMRACFFEANTDINGLTGIACDVNKKSCQHQAPPQSRTDCPIHLPD
jgi:4'-phosphopantetheinyl transferase